MLEKQIKSYKFEDYSASLENDVQKSINCHRIASIQAFNPTTQRASVQIVDYLYLPETENGTVKIITPALITNVPVQINSTTTGGLTIPINVGDFCLLAFNDRDLNNWLLSGETKNVELASFRLHDYSDAIAIIGIFPNTANIANYNNTATELFYNNTRISLQQNNIVITTQDNKQITIDANANVVIAGNVQINGNAVIQGTIQVTGMANFNGGSKTNGKENAVVGGTTVGDATTQTITTSGQ